MVRPLQGGITTFFIGSTPYPPRKYQTGVDVDLTISEYKQKRRGQKSNGVANAGLVEGPYLPVYN